MRHRQGLPTIRSPLRDDHGDRIGHSIVPGRSHGAELVEHAQIYTTSTGKLNRQKSSRMIASVLEVTVLKQELAG